MPPRKKGPPPNVPTFLNVAPGDPGFEAEIRARALERIRELEKRYPQGRRHDLNVPPLPTAIPELWPGGPSEDTGDIRLV